MSSKKQLACYLKNKGIIYDENYSTGDEPVGSEEAILASLVRASVISDYYVGLDDQTVFWVIKIVGKLTTDEITMATEDMGRHNDLEDEEDEDGE